MNPLFGLMSFITVIGAVWSVYLFQSANAFPHGHASSSSSSSSSPTSSNDNDSGNNGNNIDNDNTDGINNEPITIELPVSPSVQSPTRVTFITDNDNSAQQYQTLQSDELFGHAADASSTGNEDSSSSSSSSSSGLFNQDNNGPIILSPFQYNAAYNYVNNNNGERNSNSNDVLPSFPTHDNSGNSIYTNQASFPAMRPTNIPMDTQLKRLAILIEMRRNRQARIQSFRQVFLRGIGRSGHGGHRFHGHRNPNMAHARRAALQAFRNRLATN